ncbi:Hint domain-containing protein [Ruegeria sp. R14_0]|uniref:Hint domain-containing protein n=1 Tax=Ruegeria sp. R14_0 TaxID=2821100 RepID=UPI001ADA07F1|nr:Hint domain-containing protein [Ruegeria sp. R14_0]MBO9446498.1 Hint domain-containing protein [Ruegeria sp. R14_0]
MVSTPIDPFDAVTVTVSGDTTGTVSGDPPLPAMGDLDGTVSVPNDNWTVIGDFFEISDQPDNGTASINLFTGEWTYEVDPDYYDSLDPGDVVTDTFEVRVVGVALNPGGEFRGGEAFQTVTIQIEVICYSLGTLIRTPDGDIPIEHLSPDDLVVTMDHGAQPIRWAESAFLSPEQLETNPALYPIEIAKNALGPNCPERNLRVSPQHRMLVTGPFVELLFGETQALVAARHLVGLPGVRVVKPEKGVTYVHVLLDRHEILFAEGAPSESLYLGDEALVAMSSEGLQELREIFGSKLDGASQGFSSLARRSLKAYEAQVLQSEWVNCDPRQSLPI